MMRRLFVYILFNSKERNFSNFRNENANQMTFGGMSEWWKNLEYTHTHTYIYIKSKHTENSFRCPVLKDKRLVKV